MNIDPQTLLLGAVAAAGIWLLLKLRQEKAKDAPPRLRLETLPRDARAEMMAHLRDGRRREAVEVIRVKAGVSQVEAEVFVDSVRAKGENR